MRPPTPPSVVFISVYLAAWIFLVISILGLISTPIRHLVDVQQAENLWRYCTNGVKGPCGTLEDVAPKFQSSFNGNMLVFLVVGAASLPSVLYMKHVLKSRRQQREAAG
jgi:hypothetical protein